MIVMVIIGIISAIAFPAYTQHINKSRRVDAKTALLDLGTRQERFMSINNTYTSTPANLGYGGTFPQDVLSGTKVFYRLNVTSATATAFTATATPVNSQATDKCGTFTLTHLGAMTVSGSLTAATCW